MIRHHLVQIRPVVVSAAFCVTESFSAGRAKSEMPANTSPHFIIGALCTDCHGLVRPKGKHTPMYMRWDGKGAGWMDAPEVHRLEAHGAVPHALDPALGPFAAGRRALEAPAALVGAEELAGAEGRPGRAEEVACRRHGGESGSGRVGGEREKKTESELGCAPLM